MRKGSKVIKIKYEEDSIFVGAAWGRKRTRWGRKGARLTLEAISDYLKKGAGVHREDAYLDEVKCDLLRLIRKRLYQQALKDGKEIKEYECSFEGSFPFDCPTYLVQSDSHESSYWHSEFDILW